ncbi:hypothetical protein BTA51_00160 [Hahella sp. CCB-MM4]|nr:hypothetical protein BTA51_00160 [Hahella sp. CCB-MM4]
MGNSVGLRVRPPETAPDNHTFGALLEECLVKNEDCTSISVENICMGRSLLEQIFNDGDKVINRFPDYYIIVAGITDASTREIPLWFSNVLYGKRTGFIRRVAMGLYVYIIKPRRRHFVRLRGNKSWTTASRFKKIYTKIISELIKNTNAKILILTINQCTQRIENELPGTKENIRVFNDIIMSLKESNSRVSIIDTTDLDPDTHLPDGIHYSRAGHEIVADRIYRTIKGAKQ